MISFVFLSVTKKPIADELVTIKTKRNPSEPNKKSATSTKNNNPRAKINAISYFALEELALFLKTLTKYDVEAKNLFINNEKYYSVLSECVKYVDELNDNNNGIISNLFDSPITFEGKPAYLNVNNQKIANGLSNKFYNLIKEELLNSNSATLKLPLSNEIISKMLSEYRKEIKYLFKELQNAQQIKQRKMSFVKDHFIASNLTELSL